MPEMALPKISVVIPSFNQGEFLERTLLSIFTQEYPNLELIVIDGGSSDSTIDILHRHNDKISYWISEKDRGQSHALNKGFCEATGEIFAWQNADDVYWPGALMTVGNAFLDSPQTTVTYGDHVEIDTDDRLIGIHHAFDFSVRQLQYEGFHTNVQATFWRREVHERFGVFDEKLHRTMDYDFLIRIGRTEPRSALKRIPQILAGFRRHSGQKTQGIDDQLIREHRYIAEKLNTGRYSAHGVLLRYLYRGRRLGWYIRRKGLGGTLGVVRRRIAHRG